MHGLFPKMELLKIHVCSLNVLYTRTRLYIYRLNVCTSLENAGFNSTDEI